MELNEFIQCVAGAIEGVDPGAVGPDTDLKQLKEWDSLAVLTVVDAVDMEYGVLLKKGEIEACASVRELADLVESKQ